MLAGRGLLIPQRYAKPFVLETPLKAPASGDEGIFVLVAKNYVFLGLRSASL